MASKVIVVECRAQLRTEFLCLRSRSSFLMDASNPPAEDADDTGRFSLFQLWHQVLDKAHAGVVT